MASDEAATAGGRQRLEAAVARLETAAKPGQASEATVRALAAERDRLRAALAAAEKDRERLRAVSAAMARRVDSAIEQVTALLGR